MGLLVVWTAIEEYIESVQRSGASRLSLARAGLTELPDSVGEVETLQELHLQQNQLTSLPESIGNLEHLQTLYLQGNLLSSLPESIRRLQNLTVVFLDDNNLTALPEQICKLSNLLELSLDGNPLSALPESIGELQNLQRLYLRYAGLSVLPESIGNLQRLERLNIQHNQLTELPDSIGKLRSLQMLYLQHNKLKTLPKTFGNLHNLGALHLEDNPLSSPPPEVVRQGLEAIIDYFKQLEGDTVQLFEAKLLIVGQGEVGKTFLLNRLIHDKTPRTTSTEGIDIHQWKLKTEKSDNFQVNFWDFGGQEIYHATHQFFLSRRSLYLLAWVARKDDDLIMFDYWLNTIKVLSQGSPVLVVQNKIDERRNFVDQSYWSRLFGNIVEYHDVSAIEGAGIEALRNAIIREIDSLPHVGDELPRKWIDIREELESMEANYIPYAQYQEICKAYDMDEVQIDRLSQYFHDLGVFLRFAESPILREIVVLRPEWATGAVYKALENERVQENHGRFCFEDLPDTWSDKKLYPPETHVKLIELMKSFEICFELPQKNEYILPELLKAQKPEFEWDYSESLHFKYEYQFMPAGVISRFIVKAHDLIDEDLYWKNGIVLKFDNAKALVMKTESRVIEIWVNGVDARTLLSIIRQKFFEINRYFNNLDVKQLLKCICNECGKGSNSHFFTYEKLLRFLSKGKETMECAESGEDVSIEDLLGAIEDFKKKKKKKKRERQGTIQVTNIHGDNFAIGGGAIFNNVDATEIIVNVKEIVRESEEIDSAAKRKFLEHIDAVAKEFSKEGAKAGVKMGYRALREYMLENGIPKALRRAVRVAFGGLLD